MGRLYDRKDLEFNRWFWNKREQRLHADIANGVLPASILDEIVTEPASTFRPAKMYKVRDGYDIERQRENMKLLRTATLVSELERWRAMFGACPHCKEMKGRDGGVKEVPCIAHREGLLKAKSAVYWAGENNIAERNARGQRRDDEEITTPKDALEGAPESVGDGTLNKWEAWYLREKKKGGWSADEAASYETTPDYKGFLEMLVGDEIMTQDEYRSELERLKKEQEERDEMAPAWAGHTVTTGARRQGERFKKDTRYNLAG